MVTFVESVFFLLGGSVCHQLPQRSFYINNLQLPICTRCTGIYLSFFIGCIYMTFKKRLTVDKPISLFVVSVIAVGIIPMAVDGLSSYLGFRESNNLIRIVTGVFAAFGLPALFAFANGSSLVSIGELAVMLLVSAITAFLTYNSLINYYIISTVLSAGVFMLFFSIIKTVLTALFKKISHIRIKIVSAVSAVILIITFSIISTVLKSFILTGNILP